MDSVIKKKFTILNLRQKKKYNAVFLRISDITIRRDISEETVCSYKHAIRIFLGE